MPPCRAISRPTSLALSKASRPQCPVSAAPETQTFTTPYPEGSRQKVPGCARCFGLMNLLRDIVAAIIAFQNALPIQWERLSRFGNDCLHIQIVFQTLCEKKGRFRFSHRNKHFLKRTRGIV